MNIGSCEEELPKNLPADCRSTVRIGVASATATVGNVRVMNACLRKEKRYQSQQPPVNSLQIRRTTI